MRKLVQLARKGFFKIKHDAIKIKISFIPKNYQNKIFNSLMYANLFIYFISKKSYLHNRRKQEYEFFISPSLLWIKNIFCVSQSLKWIYIYRQKNALGASNGSSSSNLHLITDFFVPFFVLFKLEIFIFPFIFHRLSSKKLDFQKR